jgi:hypothetical protein
MKQALPNRVPENVSLEKLKMMAKVTLEDEASDLVIML